MKTVLIRGGGIAALCCEYLLHKSGFQVSLAVTERPRLPAVVLSAAALGLIRDVFDQPRLFENAPLIKKRVVAWGGAPAVEMPHLAVMVSEDSLLKALAADVSTAEPDRNPDWTIHTATPLPEGVSVHHWGSRTATATPVTLINDSGACWMEALKDGWLFLVPGWLLSVGSAALEDSALIAKQIREAGAPAGRFPAYPRIADPLCGPGWIACGSAAMAFDPICGDGTANAVREAILACAVIRAVLEGGGQETLLQHYEARLRDGFRKHLALSASFYQSANGGPWWGAELASLRDGLAWCGAQRQPEYRFRLNGFSLEPLR